MFIISLTYKCDLSDIDAYLEEHVEHLKKHYGLGNFIASGRKNPRTGGIILARGESPEALGAIIAEDPFHREGLADYEIQEFFPTMTASGLESLREELN